MNRIEERFPRLWAALDRISIVVISSLLFWLCGAPVAGVVALDGVIGSPAVAMLLTVLVALFCVPQALVGLIAGTSTLFRRAPGETLGRFWQGFKGSYLAAAGLGAVNLAAGLIIYVDILFFWSFKTWWGYLIGSFFGSVGAMVVLANVYAWPLLAFYPQPLTKAIKRSLLLAAAHPFWAIAALGVCTIFALVILLVLPGGLSGMVPAVGPGIFAAILSGFAWRVMKRYAGEEEDGPVPAE